MFTIDRPAKKSAYSWYVFEDGEFFAMYKTRFEAERAIKVTIEGRAEQKIIDEGIKAERISKVAAYIESRKDRKAAQFCFNF